MNREVLFKAKRKDNGEWVEGDLLHTRHADVVLISDFEDQLFRCDGNTLCQYTGLADKNGKKIWENDILKYSYDYEGSIWLKGGEPVKYSIGAVFWQEWRGTWAVCGHKKSQMTNQDIYVYNRNPNRTEVIGNIFDNPELLEVE